MAKIAKALGFSIEELIKNTYKSENAHDIPKGYE